jgi:hypothetical protein
MVAVVFWLVVFIAAAVVLVMLLVRFGRRPTMRYYTQLVRAAVIVRIQAILAFFIGDFCRWVIRSPPSPKSPNPIPPGQHPSLDRAFARVNRAEEHLIDCVRQLARRGEEQLNAITFDPHPHNPQQIIVDKPELPLGFIFSILIGVHCTPFRPDR